MKHSERRTSAKHMLATILILAAAMGESFYVTALSSENKKYVQQNENLQAALEQERAAKVVFTNEIKELERLLLNERKAHANQAALALPYQKLYPDLYVSHAVKYDRVDPKVVFLTFDDGPFPMTDRYLEILKKHDVKATFFVIGREDAANRARMKRIVEQGHTLAPHTYSHDYKKVYASVADYLHDFKKISDLIVSVTGEKPDIFRFPGGSVNVYNRKIYQQIIAEMLRRGYTYYDWSITSADTARNATAKSTEQNVLVRLDKNQHKIVLMHEGKPDTLAALEPLILELKKRGLTFGRLTNRIEPVCLGYNPASAGAKSKSDDAGTPAIAAPK